VDKDDECRRLLELGPEGLADALMKLADASESARGTVDRLISTPRESLTRVRSRITGLKRARKFVDWTGVSDLAEQMREILLDIETACPDHRNGLELLADFYRLDDSIFRRCDDSSGIISDVFTHEARDLFIGYAAACDDKAWLADFLMELCGSNQWWVRDVLVDSAHLFLPEEEMRRLVDGMMERWERKPEAERRDLDETSRIESLARQLKDAPLYEKVATASLPEPHGSVCLDVARVYLESGDPGTALSWIDRFPQGEIGRIRSRDELLITVLEALGDTERLKETAWRMFRRERSVEALDELLSYIGQSEREKVVAGETALILESEGFSYSDALFLARVGELEAAEDYLLKHEGSIDGDVYFILLPTAKELDKAGRPLAASVVYRALLDSILARGQSKYYHHGIRYLKKLDNLQAGIVDWKSTASHEAYRERLLAVHGRKRSFWSRYETGA
jgi:hypothetical protein